MHVQVSTYLSDVTLGATTCRVGRPTWNLQYSWGRLILSPYAPYLITSLDVIMRGVIAAAFAAVLPYVSSAQVKCHGQHFVPDAVLRLTLENVPLSCESRYSTVINGTVPGPELHIPAGKTSWVRVYNDAKVENATVVSINVVRAKTCSLICDTSTGMA